MPPPPDPNYALEPLREADAAAICGWRYPAPYDIYQWPDWERAVAEGRDFADPALRAKHYRAVRREGDFVGFVQWLPMVDEAGGAVIRLGLGLRPDLCGAGRGAGFAAFLARETARLHPGARIELEVAAGNVRARKAYERAGFAVTDEYALPVRGQELLPVCSMTWRGEGGAP
ncbi:GNAT family N-acetyltransferase [Paenibacillus sp.]|uniref:GNAT family N-acetyltransferase n=1 Tax=Paenibacillus sp. TaxID=58172 RepID=UPI002D696D88|nr:GNAT family N-acetyltransferase [Paenibacillus sp.]HZG58595.1 GNAT family N-acetyltransferase [Paenibacillus sp.]